MQEVSAAALRLRRGVGSMAADPSGSVVWGVAKGAWIDSKRSETWLADVPAAHAASQQFLITGITK